MGDGELLFFVLVADEFIQVRAKPQWTLSFLLKDMRLPQNDPSVPLTRISSRRCNFYVLKNPIEFDETKAPDISQIMASLQDKNKYEKLRHNKTLKNIAQNFAENYLYLVIEAVPDDAEKAVTQLKKSHPNLYRCLEVTVRAALRWTLDDVRSNGGIFVEDDDEGTARKPLEMLDLETRLCGKRSFNIPDDDLDLSIARHYGSQFESTYIRNNLSEDQATVKSSREFIAFYVLLRCYHPDAPRYQAATSSSLKAHALKGNFILPPFFSGRDSTDELWYQEEMPWKFPLFVSCPTLSALPRKYMPASDFSVWFRELDLPLIIAEVISERSEQDRYRMLLQAIALARLVFYLRRPESATHPFIVAIYLTANLNAERYIVMKTGSATNEVYISQKNFDLSNDDDAIAFQREMYNLASVLESILDQLDDSKRDELQAIKKKASGMMSLHSSGAWTKKTVARTLDSIVEEPEDSGPRDEDDLGVFGDDNVRADLDRMNYKVAYVAFGHPNIAPIMSSTDGEIVGCLKFVKDGGKEIEILQYLADLPSESNHTVRPICIWRVAGGAIIAMPVAGNSLTSLNDPDAHLWSLSTQLFEAVKFMHDHNVAHLDLKPSNILVPSDYGRLTVIDFGVSFQLRHAAQLLQGRAGTEGYIAPEVGRMKFSPIRADLWSTGKIVQELCMLCRPSLSRDWLLALSKQLLDDDPCKRPMMTEVLQRMLSYDAVDALDGGHTSPFPPMSSGLAAVSA